MPTNPQLDALPCVIDAKERANAATTLEELRLAITAYGSHPIAQAGDAITGRYGNSAPHVRPLMVLGKSPGATEVKTGRSYQGPAAQVLMSAMREAGFGIEDTYHTYATYWRPPSGNDPKATQIAFSRPFVLREIELVRPRAIVVLGAKAMDCLTGEHPDLTNEAGVVFKHDGIKCHLLRNHGYVMRFPSARAPFVRGLARAWSD